MRNIREFPDQMLSGKLQGAFYDPEIKPYHININFINNKINIRYKHNDFIDLFGDDVNMDEIVQSPGELTYEKKFKSDDGIITFIASTYIDKLEIAEKKLKQVYSMKYANI